MSPRIAFGAALAAFSMIFASLSRLVMPVALCCESDCDSFEPSETSCWQFLTDEKDEEDDEDDEEEDDEDELELYALDELELELELLVVVVDALDVVAGAELFELPPQPAASAARTKTEASARLRVMFQPPCRDVTPNLLRKPVGDQPPRAAPPAGTRPGSPATAESQAIPRGRGRYARPPSA